MDQFSGYHISETIFRGNKYQICRAFDNNNNSYTIKTPVEENISYETLARLKKEYQILISLHSPYVIKAVDLIKQNNSLMLLQENFKGSSLKAFIEYHTPVTSREQLINTLKIALQIVKGLSDIHENNIIHQDLNPSNILINSATQQIKIIDFGMARNIMQDAADHPLNDSIGTYPYMAPEQTGRVEHQPDFRADYYSLGITLYELITGKLPFQAENQREWIHAHVAKKPPELDKIHPEIPLILSQIVAKLLQKEPDARYQSSFGLLKDLENSIRIINQPDLATNYTVGKHDISRDFDISNKIYGREKSVDEVLKIYNQVKKGQPACLIIHGYSGIGKTAFVEHIKKQLNTENVIFASGKFEQFQSNNPYSAVSQTLKEIVYSIINKSKPEIAQWRKKILSAIPNNARILIDLVPELEVITGKQPSLSHLSPAETQQRFDITIQKFYELFAEPAHPLVVFVDDLHWADQSSVDLMLKILGAFANLPVLFMGAYRTEEFENNKGLVNAIETIRRSKINYHEIKLGALSYPEIKAIVADTFKSSAPRIDALSKICFNRTHGNPLFIKEYITNLYQNKLINYDVTNGQWLWNIQEIEQQEVTSNIADLLSQRILDLPEDTREILKMASCLGSTFNLHILSMTSNKDITALFRLIQTARRNALIVPAQDNIVQDIHHKTTGNQFKFVHDRVQQSFYNLLSAHQKATWHLKAGKKLIDEYTEQEINENLFDITHQLNKGIIVINPTEKPFLAEFNLKSCTKAKNTGAFSQAYKFGRQGLQLLTSENWHTKPKLTFEIHAECAEAAALTGHHEEMEQLLQDSYYYATSVLNKARIHEIRTQSLIAQNKQQEAVRETLYLLKILGINFPKKVSTAHLLLHLFKTRYQLNRFKPENITTLPPMTDRAKLAAMRNMANIISVLYRTDSNLFALLIFKLIELTLRHGVAPISPVGFIAFGLLTNVIFNNIPRAYQLGTTGMQLFDRLEARNHWAQAFYIYSVGISPWKEPLATTNKNLFKAYEVARETGDFEYMMSASAAGVHYLFRAGHELNELVKDTKYYKQSISGVYEKITSSQFDVLIQMFTNFIEPRKHPEELISDIYDEREMIAYHQKDGDDTSLLMIYLDKLTLAYYFRRDEQALAIAQTARKYLQGVAGLLMYANFFFFDSLTILANYENSRWLQKRKFRKRLRINQQKMHKWAQHAPVNFLCKYTLIEAEKAGKFGKTDKAARLFEKAIRLTRQNGYVHEEALANELCGMFWFNHHNTTIAAIYLSKAFRLYNLWGAGAKSEALHTEFPELIASEIQRNKSSSSSSSSSDRLSLSVDVETIVDASKAISGHIIPEALIKQTLKIILEHAGAQKGVLMLYNQDRDNWQIEATGKVADNQIQLALDSKPLNDNIIPTSIITTAIQSSQKIILHDAACEGNFMGNEYIQKHETKSLLALPIIRQAQTTGILYLENNLKKGVFTDDRVNVLSILCTQMAISLENARLYKTLEEKVKLRTTEVINQKEELQKQAEKLQAMNKELQDINATKDKLFSIIGHDLRNPFNIILGQVGLLAENYDKLPSDEIKKSITLIDDASKNAFQLLQNLLDWARAQSGQFNFYPRNISMNRIINRDIDMQQNIAESKNIRLTNHVPDQITVYADEDMASTIIRNLVSNALKFTSESGTVDIYAREDTEFIEISIEDNGIGIEAENIPKLFQSDESYTTRGTSSEKGVGLGLKICKDFVAQNGGRINVDSNLGIGTRIYFTLPRSKSG